MDVETTQALQQLGSQIDRVETAMGDGFADVRGEMQAGFARIRGEMQAEFRAVRAEIAGLREELRDEFREGLELNWTRTQSLFESLRGDVQMLAGHVADLASRRPRS